MHLKDEDGDFQGLLTQNAEVQGKELACAVLV